MKDLHSGNAVDLMKLAQGYSYDENSFAPFYARIREKITAFDQDFGSTLNQHHQNVGYDSEQFLVREGYPADVAKKIGHAFALHDSGKIKQDPELWRQTEEKPVFTPEQKKEREKHGRLGLSVIDETISEMGLSLTPDQMRHIDIVKYLMVHHHERLNGTGPEGMDGSRMDNILRIITIVDTVDGKKKAKGLSAIFDDMSGAEGTKHAGQFDVALVERYAHYYMPAHEAVGQPGLAKQAHSL